MRAAGPLGRYVRHAEKGVRVDLGDGYAEHPNAQTLLRRVSWVADENGHDGKLADRDLRYVTAKRMFPPELLRAATLRRVAAAERLAERGAHVTEVVVNPVDRMVLGLGDATPTEIGFRLHGTYGTPVLPGQSLKGVTAAASREDGEDRTDRTAVFGDGKRRGAVMFLDALPAGTAGDLVTPDVLTPHGEEWEQPNPVFFLTATRSLKFRAHLVVTGTQADADAANKWLKKGLEEIGIGAKTSSGYGYMEVKPVTGPGGRSDKQPLVRAPAGSVDQ